MPWWGYLIVAGMGIIVLYAAVVLVMTGYATRKASKMFDKFDSEFKL